MVKLYSTPAPNAPIWTSPRTRHRRRGPPEKGALAALMRPLRSKDAGPACSSPCALSCVLSTNSPPGARQARAGPVKPPCLQAAPLTEVPSANARLVRDDFHPPDGEHSQVIFTRVEKI